VAEIILIVDDEEPVRRTFRDWLEQSGFGCQVLTAADAETALVLANQHAIDLAILDWNLGAGSDGLQLLEDLAVFNPDVVAILVTGFANQATPLDAMRKGVRDYLDKNQDLNRTTFLTAVRRQLDRIVPAKRERRFHQVLVAFREAVEKILPLVQSTAAMQDPVPLPDAVIRLLRFVMTITRAADAVLLVRSYDANRLPAEFVRVYDTAGKPLTDEPVPFSRSIAGSVVSRQECCIMNRLDDTSGTFEVQPFERGRRSLLAAAMNVAPGILAVLELFDKQAASLPPLAPGGRGVGGEGGFTAEDQVLLTAAADVGTELLRQALAQRQTQQVLFDAVGAALRASELLSAAASASRAASAQTETERLESPPPDQVLEQLRRGLGESPAAIATEETLRLAEAVRVLALRHGAPAVQHCLRLVEELQLLLDTVTDTR
jgi:ActR/RegA family two-component response regulator